MIRVHQKQNKKFYYYDAVLIKFYYYDAVLDYESAIQALLIRAWPIAFSFYRKQNQCLLLSGREIIRENWDFCSIDFLNSYAEKKPLGFSLKYLEEKPSRNINYILLSRQSFDFLTEFKSQNHTTSWWFFSLNFKKNLEFHYALIFKTTIKFNHSNFVIQPSNQKNYFLCVYIRIYSKKSQVLVIVQWK